MLRHYRHNVNAHIFTIVSLPTYQAAKTGAKLSLFLHIIIYGPYFFINNGICIFGILRCFIFYML